METLCPGTCNIRYRRERAIYEDAVAKHAALVSLRGPDDPVPDPPRPPEIQPVQGEPVWCARCKGIIRRELADLDELAMSLAALPAGIKPASDGSGERVRTARSVFAPSPSPGVDDLDELYRWLVAWENYYRDLSGWVTAPQRGFLSNRVTAAVNWLGATGHFDGLMMTDLAEPFGTETRRWHRELIAKTHSARSARHVNKRCPRCSLYTLWEEAGKDYVQCKNQDCGRMMTREELNQATGATSA